MDQAFSRGHIGGDGNVVYVAQAEQVRVVRLIRLGVERITEKQEEVDLIIGNACRDLLISSLGAAEEFLDFKACRICDEFTGSSGCAECMSGKGSAIGNAELNHQFFFGIVRDECYIH